MKKVVLAFVILAMFGLVGQAYAAKSDKCPKHQHHNKAGECVRNEKAATPATPATPAK